MFPFINQIKSIEGVVQVFGETSCVNRNCREGKGEVFGCDTINGVEWYFFVCEECGEEWQRTARSAEEEDEFKIQIDALLLGFVIFEAAYNCLQLIGFYNEKRYCNKATEEACLKALTELESLLLEKEKSWGLSRMKRIISMCKEEIEWGIKELTTLAEEAQGITQIRAGEVTRHVRGIVHRTP